MSQINVNTITGKDGGSAVNFPNGITVTGVVTATTLNQNVTGNVTAGSFTGPLTGNADTATVATNAQGLSGTPNITVGSVTGSTASFSGNVSVGGTLTYEDVTNIDSVGIVTARSGLKVSSGGASFVGSLTEGQSFLLLLLVLMIFVMLMMDYSIIELEILVELLIILDLNLTLVSIP